MDHRQNDERKTKTKSVPLSFDDFEFDESKLRPLSKGLGFNQDSKKLEKTYNSFNTAAPVTRRNISTLQESKRPVASKGNLEGLSAFYGGDDPRQIKAYPKKTKLVAPPQKIQKAQTWKLFSSWLIDTLLISSMVLLTGILPGIAIGMELSFLKTYYLTPDVIPYEVALLGLYYIVYFSILDLEASPGKKLFGVYVINTNNKPLRAAQTFRRSIISLASLVLLGIPALIDIPGKLSDTQVVVK